MQNLLIANVIGMRRFQINDGVGGQMDVNRIQSEILYSHNALSYNIQQSWPDQFSSCAGVSVARTRRTLPLIGTPSFLTGSLSRYRAVVVAATSCNGDRHKRMRASRDRQVCRGLLNITTVKLSAAE
ncbi:MAG: hypothetical protein JWR69_1549 [Pedosphaera sp.]|nr:hypothetical protein [Pedosphaera sp.]